MQIGSFLVKEIVGHSVESSHIDGSFSAPFPIKEVFLVRHQVQPVKTILGENCVAYFGEIEFKVYCVSCKDSALHLVEHKLDYKGFCFFDKTCLSKHPQVRVTTRVKDTFADTCEPDLIKIFAPISVELVLTVHKQISLPEVQAEDHYEVDIDENQPEQTMFIDLTPR